MQKKIEIFFFFLRYAAYNFFQLNYIHSDNKYDEGAVVQISTVFGTIYQVACRTVFWNETF